MVPQWMLMEDLVTVETSPTSRYPTSAALTRRASSTSPGLSGTTMVTSRATLGWLVTHSKHDGEDTSPTLTTEKNAEAQSWPDTFGNWKTTTSPTPSPGTSSAGPQATTLSLKPADCAPLRNFLFYTTPERQALTNGRKYFDPVSTETSTSFSPEETESKTSRRTGIPLSVSLLLQPHSSQSIFILVFVTLGIIVYWSVQT